MSFGSFGLFNFFQCPNTGSYPTTEESQANLDYILYGGNGASGTVADFNWFFPYAISRVPIQVIAAQGTTYKFTLFSDTYFPPSEVPTLGQGLHWAQSISTVSGNFKGYAESMGMGALFSGDFLPLVSDSGAQMISLSGDFAGFPTGYSVILPIISGNVVADNYIPVYLIVSTSGDFAGYSDILYLKINNSGNIVGDNVQSFTMTSNMSGDFFGVLSDSNTLQYGFSGTYGSSSGIFVEYLNGEFIDDNSLISYTFNNFSRGTN